LKGKWCYWFEENTAASWPWFATRKQCENWHLCGQNSCNKRPSL